MAATRKATLKNKPQKDPLIKAMEGIIPLEEQQQMLQVTAAAGNEISSSIKEL